MVCDGSVVWWRDRPVGVRWQCIVSAWPLMQRRPPSGSPLRTEPQGHRATIVLGLWFVSALGSMNLRRLESDGATGG